MKLFWSIEQNSRGSVVMGGGDADGDEGE